jgi:hypothetical protein
MMTENLAGRVGWSDSLVVIDGMMPLEQALPLIKAAPGWVVISRAGSYLYAFRLDELLKELSARGALVDPAVARTPLSQVLDLHEDLQSTPTTARTTVPPIDRSWRPRATAPSVDRWVEVSTDGEPRAVGTMVLAGGTRRGQTRGMRPSPAGAEPPSTAPAAPPTITPGMTGTTRAKPPQP